MLRLAVLCSSVQCSLFASKFVRGLLFVLELLYVFEQVFCSMSVRIDGATYNLITLRNSFISLIVHNDLIEPGLIILMVDVGASSGAC